MKKRNPFCRFVPGELTMVRRDGPHVGTEVYGAPFHDPDASTAAELVSLAPGMVVMVVTVERDASSYPRDPEQGSIDARYTDDCLVLTPHGGLLWVYAADLERL